MKKILIILALAALGVLFLLAKPVKASSAEGLGFSTLIVNNNDSKNEREVKKEFEVKPGGKLTIDLKTGSSIEIKGWDKDLLSANAVIKNEDEDNQIEFSFTKNGNDVEITSEYKYHRNHNHSSARLIIQMPQKYSVDFKTMGGSVTIENVEGTSEGKTMGGAIHLSRLRNYVDIETMGGEISLKDSEVDGKLKTMGGAIHFENVKGDVDASTMGGAIKQINVQGKSKSGKGVKISTMGGPIDVDDAPNGANLKTMGGNIHVKKAAKFVYAETMGGEINIEEIDGGVEATTMGGDVDVKMIGDPKTGNRDVLLSSKGGDITLIVPAGLPMDVDIKITVTDREDVNDYKIVNDFQIKEDRTDRDGHKRYVKGTGTVNGGGNKIKIRTINGNVYLRKG